MGRRQKGQDMELNLRDYQTDLIVRTHRAMAAGSRKIMIVSPTGSGKTAMFAWLANQTQKKNNTVWFLVHRRELMDQTIETFERFDIPMERIHVGMVATVANKPDKLPKPDIIIFDECHHSSAGTWKKIIDHFPDTHLIGLTATPCRLDGKPLGAIYEEMILGVTTADLIGQGYLSDFRYFAPSVADLSGLKKKGSDFDAAQAADILSQRAVFGDVIKHWQEYAAGYQTIVYCSSINHSQATAEAFQEAGINAVHFDGNTPAKIRKQIVDDFRNKKITVLCNVDLIGEGFDVPDCWCCVLLRPTASLGLYIQQAGRALRPQPGKTAIVLDHVGNHTRHGLPDDPREWSLTDKVKPRKEYGEDGKLIVTQCTKCYGVYETKKHDRCPYCGAERELTREEIRNIKEIRLQEIKRQARANADERVKHKDLNQCKTLFEIMAWCRKNGRKPGYGYMYAKRKGIV